VNLPFPIEPEQAENFWSKVDKTPGFGPDGDCWRWTAGMKSMGEYGGFYLRQINNTAGSHVVAYCLAHNHDYGELDEGLVVRHRCATPSCVNPKHLQLGTPQHNADDRVRDGNSLPGEENPRAQLTAAQVIEIRRLWVTTELKLRELADRFGVTPECIGGVVRNKTWHDPNYRPPDYRQAHGRGLKYTSEQVEEVKRLRSIGMTFRAIHTATGISVSQVSNIVNGRQRQKGEK
jgi:hypothetical protein